MSEEEKAAALAADPYFYGWRRVREVGEDGTETWKKEALTEEEILHPREDDEIMQSPVHDVAVAYLRDVCQRRLAGRSDVRILCDVRVDWEEPGVEPHGPDIAVFRAVTTDQPFHWGTYFPRRNGARPMLVIEVTSPNTRNNDLIHKVREYEEAEVPLYVIVDLECLETHVQGKVFAYRGGLGSYRYLGPDSRGRLWIDPLRIWVAVQDNRVVCFDEQERLIPVSAELQRAFDQAESRCAELSQQAEEAILARRASETQSRKLKRIARKRDEERKAAALLVHTREKELNEATLARQAAERQRDEKEKELARIQSLLQRLPADQLPPDLLALLSQSPGDPSV